jgi:hypothetical protein
MNIAICFWGLTRSLKYTHENLKNIIEEIEKFGTVTTFMHTYRIDRPYSNIWGKEENIILDPNEYKLLNPDHFIYDDQDEIAEKIDLPKYHSLPDSHYKTNYQTIDNFILAMYSQKRVTDLMLRHHKSKKYTHVVFMRPDVLFETSLKRSWFESVDNTNIITTSFDIYYFDKKMINDRFAICTPEVAKLYGTRFSVLLQYSKQKELHSERFLFDVLTHHGIKIVYKWICFNRVRATGRISDDCKNRY